MGGDHPPPPGSDQRVVACGVVFPRQGGEGSGIDIVGHEGLYRCQVVGQDGDPFLTLKEIPQVQRQRHFLVEARSPDRTT